MSNTLTDDVSVYMAVLNVEFCPTNFGWCLDQKKEGKPCPNSLFKEEQSEAGCLCCEECRRGCAEHEFMEAR